MNIHPLFAGFAGYSLHAVGRALGFAIHVETVRGALPDTLPVQHASRLQDGGDLVGFQFTGGWSAPGVHCLMFTKPLTTMAADLWRVGQEHQTRAVAQQALYLAGQP
jgi:hypothetical protein